MRLIEDEIVVHLQERSRSAAFPGADDVLGDELYDALCAAGDELKKRRVGLAVELKEELDEAIEGLDLFGSEKELRADLRALRASGPSALLLPTDGAPELV